ncbi:hypothetical protein [Thalassobacillus devorans]|nr:hypothetical protein [Thalassobacillus devorans]
MEMKKQAKQVTLEDLLLAVGQIRSSLSRIERKVEAIDDKVDGINGGDRA